jgi:hypothetical protein
MAIGTATTVSRLTAEEKAALDALAKKGGLTISRRTQRTGSLYQALDNLSVPREGDPDKACDLVLKGNTVTMSDELAAMFLPPHKPVALIRPAKEASEPLPRIPNRAKAGPMRIPAFARPDPAGATSVQIVEDVPESTQILVGSENEGGEPSAADQESAILDAIDTKVRRE